MFIWQNKKHELCVTFNNNRPVDNPDLILNEQSAKIIQQYIDDNRPSCVHEYGEGTFAVNPSRLIYVCKNCGLSYSKGITDLYLTVSNPDVKGTLVGISNILDPAEVYYELTYTLPDDAEEHRISNKLQIEDLPEPPNGGVPKSYSWYIPFMGNEFDECTSAYIYISIRDINKQRITEKEYRLDIQQYSRSWKDISII